MLFCFHFSIQEAFSFWGGWRRQSSWSRACSSTGLCGKNGKCWIDLDRFGSMINTLCIPLPLLEGFSDLLAFAPRSHRFLLVGRTFSFHVWMPRVTLGFYYFSNGLVECEPIFDLPTFFCHWLAWTCSSLSPLAQQHFCVLLQHHGWKLKAGRHRAHSLGASHLYI